MGFGTIGRNLAKCLRNSGSIVKISEIDIKKAVIAQLEGFEHTDPRSVVKDCDIIIGTTGRTSLGFGEILSAKNNAIFASASSKQMEIDMKILEALSTSKKILSIGSEYQLLNGNNLLVLADGFPVNFYCSESVPDKIIDFILSEILECAAKLATQRFDPGIHRDCIDETMLAELFYNIHFG
jgi:adenosylhomocysteinase